jgi:serine protease AprX
MRTELHPHSTRGRGASFRGLCVAVTIAMTVTVSAGAASAGLLGGLLGVASTALDTTAGLLGGADWGYAASQTPMSAVNKSIGSDGMWSRGYTGAGIGVALIDTGAVPVQGLTVAGHVVNGPDVSFESQSSNLRDLDGFGHGTHLAGIIAGNDGTSSGFKGVAPDSTLVSVRVGASSGATDVSQVIAAIDWVVQHRDDPGLHIRVLNLAYGTDGLQSSTRDPLAHAVENAWRAGIVVVVAGGNAGTTRASLDNPATDPYVVAVGADDINGTSSTLDDSIPSFSSRGSATRHVDVVAPGQSIVSLRNPGSYVDTEYPGAVVDGRFFKGSGTSQAAAVVSGAAALLLQQRPTLTPDAVKRLLTSTAQPILLTSPADAGAGLINLTAASAAAPAFAVQSFPTSTGLGTLEASRGTQHVGDNGVDLTGERDVFGATWSPQTWAAASSGQTAWQGGTWNGSVWAGTCWCGSSWTAKTWSIVSWPQANWAGVSWSSRSWSDQAWVSHSWSGGGWTSRSWSSRSWSGSSWSAAHGDD